MDYLDKDVAALRAVIEESPTPTAIYTGLEMRISMANKAMIKTWGKQASVVGKTIPQALPELDNQPFFQILTNVYTTGITYEATEDLAQLVINGKLQNCYFNFTYKPLLNNEGRVWAVLNTATDVTELVLARQRIKEAEAQLAFSLNAAEIGTWDLNLTNNLVSWDARTKELFGFPKDDAVFYHDVLKYMHPDDSIMVDQAVNNALNPKLRAPYDIKFRTIGAKDGQLRWLHCRGRAYFNDQDQPNRFSGIAMDITPDVMVNERIQSAEQIAQLALDNVGAGSYLIDVPTNTLSYTPLFAKVTTGSETAGLSREAFINHLHPDDRHLRQIAYEKALRTGKLFYEARFVWNDGSTHWVRITGRFTFDSNYTPTHFAGIVQDITAEAEARQEQQKLLWLIDNSKDFISLSNWDGQLTYLNKAGQQMMGFDSLEEAQRHNTEYLMPADAHKINQVINPALLQDGRWAGQVVYKHHKTGERIPGFATTLLLKDMATGLPVARASVIRDMRPELRAREEQEKLISIVDNSFDGIMVLNKHHEVTYINAKGRELIGYHKSAGVPINGADYIFPEDVMSNENMLKTVKWQGNFAGLQRYRHLTTGQVINAFIHAVRLHDPVTGDFNGLSIVIRDMGPIMAAQQALVESEELFRGITTASPTALWVADAEGNVTFVNQTWIDWTGKPLEQHLGTGWLNSIAQEDKEAALAKFKADTANYRFYENQYRIRHTDGMEHWIVSTGNPQYSAQGIFKGYIGACVDITEQKLMQKQKDDFIGIASHELKTPVTSIKAYAQVLQAIFQREGDDKKAVMLGKMNSQVDRLTCLIADLLDVTKIQSGRLRFNDNYFDFNELLIDLTEDLQRTSTNHKILTQFNTALQVYADKDRIAQVITNLITNAIKYSPQADSIIVSSKVVDNEVHLCVQDFGIGINPTKKDRVFEQFYRVSGDMQHTFPGLGLGLYISSEIIKREGGHIWVNSIEGEGSTFCFALPLNR